MPGDLDDLLGPTLINARGLLEQASRIDRLMAYLVGRPGQNFQYDHLPRLTRADTGSRELRVEGVMDLDYGHHEHDK